MNSYFLQKKKIIVNLTILFLNFTKILLKATI
jgi:hypothetical protein